MSKIAIWLVAWYKGREVLQELIKKTWLLLLLLSVVMVSYFTLLLNVVSTKEQHRETQELVQRNQEQLEAIEGELERRKREIEVVQAEQHKHREEWRSLNWLNLLVPKNTASTPKNRG